MINKEDIKKMYKKDDEPFCPPNRCIFKERANGRECRYCPRVIPNKPQGRMIYKFNKQIIV